jgi:thiamine biosynthesis lipoprotein
MAVVERRFRAMASAVQIVGHGDGRQRTVEHAVDGAAARIAHLEARWSRFVDDSDISQLNIADGRHVAVHRDTITLLFAMRQGWDLTDGRFDPTTLRALVDAGYAASVVDPSARSLLPSPVAEPASTFGAVEIDAAERKVRLPRGVAIDPGGIGKGLAADLVAHALVDEGLDGALVAIGGDLAVAGTPPDRAGWTVIVEAARDPQRELCRLAVDRGGIATSNTRSRRWIAHGHQQHHLIDPSTGRPSATDLDAMTIIAATAWLAEVHATAALLLGSDHAIPYCEQHGLSAIAQPRDRPPIVTADLRWLPLAREDGSDAS